MTMTANCPDNLSLPDPLITCAGKAVESRQAWQQERRSEILELFSKHVYGRTPAKPFDLSFDVFDEDLNALDGKAIRKQVAIEVTSGEKRLRMELLMYLPLSARQQPVPVMLLLNFGGNHTIHPDPAIVLPKGYIRENYSPAEAFRGSRYELGYPIEAIIARGYAIATVYYGDIDPDFDDGFENGVHPLFDRPDQRSEDAWGAVGAWAWGLSRSMDYLESDHDVDASRVAVLGHSRLGKASLWAGAQDERFSIVISNNSGCTGAAIARRKAGETIAVINKNYPHWFCRNYIQYNNKEEALPVDQHMLVSLIAPRPVYISSADLDDWADPQGEFLSCIRAEPVYRLFGLSGLQSACMPSVNQPMSDGDIGYHIRAGKHALTPYDWHCFMDYADKYWKLDDKNRSGP
jgi:hypothetical protein